jgi:exoribonuclease II
LSPIGTAKIRSAFVLLSNVAVTELNESATAVAERLVEYVMLAANVSVNGALSVHGVFRQLVAFAAGNTNFGSAFESTETVDDGIAAPLEPKVCSAPVGP